MSAAVPLVDDRNRAEIEASVRARIGGYTPGWRPVDGSSGGALLDVFSGHVKVFATGLNSVPERSRLSFLDMLGTTLLAARPARAPLVFELMDDSPDDARVLANTAVGAQPAPPAASPLTDVEADMSAGEPVVFATTQSIAIARARLAAVYSLDPPDDEVLDHTEDLTSGFSFFDNLDPVAHAIYVGHDEHFAFSGKAVVRLSFGLASYPPESVRQGLALDWSYRADGVWIPMSLVEDGTDGFTTSGEIVLESSCGPDAAPDTIGEHESFWIRGVLSTPLVPEGAGGDGRLPAIDIIDVRVEFSKDALQADAAFFDTAPLDTSNRFYPFGARPAQHGTFYLACEEAFTRGNASVQIRFKLYKSVDDVDEDLALSWNYFDGEQWQDLGDFEFDDATANLTKGVIPDEQYVTFRCPVDWTKNSVNGVDGYWLRVRIDEGGFGEARRLEVDASLPEQPVTLIDETYDPPIVEKLRLSYTYVTDPVLADHCVSYNNAVYSEHSEDCRWSRRLFEPFATVDELQPAIHFGFDQRLPPGLISLYLHAAPKLVTGDEIGRATPYIWEYLNADGWAELSVRDETDGFRKSGMIQFVGPGDAVSAAGRGGDLYRIRARLKRGESIESVVIDGLWLNAAWATHRDNIDGDILGASDGNRNQSFTLHRATGSILSGERVEVQEWSGSGNDWESLVADLDEADVRIETDSTDAVSAVWVSWRRVEHLFDSSADDRHYTLERATGLLRFGDGIHGRIPPAGGRVIASYDSGGGVIGNVAAGAISEPRAGVAYLQSVSNPVAAEGGTEVEASERVALRGPQRLRHRDRAVTTEDIEWLAREASPAVYHARCLPITGANGFAERGWITVLVAAKDEQPRPLPGAELRRQVLQHLSARCPAAIAGQIRIAGPEFVLVGVSCAIVPLIADDAAPVEARVRDNLNAFLHPVTGGPADEGWHFGEAVYLSQIATLIEQTDGVDCAIELRMTVDGAMFDEFVPVDENALVAAGDHEIKITLD